jgi:hypothetical protein
LVIKIAFLLNGPSPKAYQIISSRDQNKLILLEIHFKLRYPLFLQGREAEGLEKCEEDPIK